MPESCDASGAARVAGLSSINATPAPANRAAATLEGKSLSEHVRVLSSAAVVGWMHWKTAAVIASVSAIPTVKHSWNAASRQPSTPKRKSWCDPLGQRSGRSSSEAAPYMTTIETSSLARLKASGLISFELRHREITRL
eukprot:scaffold124131_cov39-Tisochrysis_lutea.AAC.2